MKHSAITKTCRACNQELSTSRFQKNRRAKDGLKAKCRSCRSSEAHISRSNKTQVSKRQHLQPAPSSDPSQAMITNHSQYDTRILTTIVKFAMKQAGCKPAGVTIRLRRSLTRLRGCARGHCWEMHLPSRPNESQNTVKNMSIPVEERRRAFAIRLYLTAVHEATHVADHQQDKYFGNYNRKWANRPHEIRAMTAELNAHGDLNADRVPKIEAAIEALAKTMTFA